MKLIVLGASGRTGRNIIELATERGHDVIPIVRDPAKARPEWRDRSVVVEGTDSGALAEAMRGADAVASTIGHVPGEDIHVMEKCAIAAVQAMRTAGVSRLAVITASGPFTDGDGVFTRYIAKPLVQRLLRNQFDDMVATERVIGESGLDWTVVRPPRLTDGAARHRYRARRDGNVRRGFQLARADLARAVVDLLEDPTAVGQAVSVAR